MLKTSNKENHSIVEKELGITGDYQYKALQSRNYLQSNWHNNKLVVLDEIISTYKPKTVLDLGTGSGNFELFFAKKLKKIVGVDYNDEALAFLESELKRKMINNVQLINQNIINVSKISNLGKFDMILLMDVLEHLEITNVNVLIPGLKKLLNPHGKIVIITPNYGGFWPLIERFVDKFTIFPHLEDIQHVTKFNSNVLLSTFKKHEFNLVKDGVFNTFSFIFPGKFLSSLMCKFELWLPFPFGNLILGVFET